MVSHPGRTTDTRRIRRLKASRAIDVEVDATGMPVNVDLGDRMQPVTLARRPWRVDQYWWRAEPVSRVYYRVVAETGPPLTFYLDEISGEWFRQEY